MSLLFVGDDMNVMVLLHHSMIATNTADKKKAIGRMWARLSQTPIKTSRNFLS